MSAFFSTFFLRTNYCIAIGVFLYRLEKKQQKKTHCEWGLVNQKHKTDSNIEKSLIENNNKMPLKRHCQEYITRKNPTNLSYANTMPKNGPPCVRKNTYRAHQETVTGWINQLFVTSNDHMARKRLAAGDWPADQNLPCRPLHLHLDTVPHPEWWQCKWVTSKEILAGTATSEVKEPLYGSRPLHLNEVKWSGFHFTHQSKLAS